MFAVPEMMTTAAGELATIGSDLGAVHLAAAAPTTTLIPAAADEVSTAVAQLFSRYGTGFQALDREGIGVSRPVRADVEIECERLYRHGGRQRGSAETSAG